MKITKIGRDLITISEDNLYNVKILGGHKIHLIKFDFFCPTKEKIKRVLSLFKETNRYIVDNNIRIYNYALKYTSKKYYVMNKPNIEIITFFRKNNKILFNFLNLSPFEKQFFLTNCFEDVLKNTEIILIDKEIFKEKEPLLEKWNGNVIISNSEIVL